MLCPLTQSVLEVRLETMIFVITKYDTKSFSLICCLSVFLSMLPRINQMPLEVALEAFKS